MKRKLLFVALGIAAIGLLAGFGFGPSMGRGAMDPKKLDRFVTWRINDVLDDLEATPQQRQQVLALKDRLLAEAKPMHEARAQVHEQLTQMWKSDKPDSRVLHALIDQRVEEFRALAHKAADGAIELHGILSPAQRAELAEKAEEHHREGGRWHHPRE
ncbi:MAG: Spy/CpxP family protein refolding chaperone [Deltaproteobacteria bacterium]|nr:Spy/CpxP family protein refolding chaperone [Deltaproteobacteria bacterium]